MTRPGDEVEALRERYLEALEDAPSGETPDAELVWDAVSGALSPERRREVVDRVATDAAWAEAWRLAHEIWKETEEGRRETETGPARRVGFWPRNPYLAAAASVALLLGAGILARQWLTPEPLYRDPGGSRIESLVPEDAALSREALTLEWSSSDASARYDVTVTTEALEPVSSARDLDEPRYRVPESDLSDLPSGSKLFWQVTARLPDGTTDRSPTFAVTLR